MKKRYDRAHGGQAGPCAGFQAHPDARNARGAYVRPADGVSPHAVSAMPGASLAEEAQAYSRARYGAAACGPKKRKAKKSPVWTAVSIVAAIVLAACLVALGVIGYGYWHGTKVYDDIAQQAFPQKEADALASMTVDWDALLAQNSDTVGWIYMPGTSIDYPIVQGETDEEYLKKDFAGNTGGIVHKGAIFLSADNDPSMADHNNVIYGHNMNDDTMFAHLLQMADQQVFDSARTFYVFTPTQNYRCSTFALDVVDSTQTSILQFDFPDSNAMADYVASRIEESVPAPPQDVDAAAASKLFTLITCGDDYATTRAVLFGAVVEAAVPDNAPAE
ncbi:MAG: class B sortase [Slackia sp.]|nr:class B sortase [Slackia sp.]